MSLQKQEKVMWGNCLQENFCKWKKKLSAFDSVFANAGKSYVASIEFLQMQEKVMCLRYSCPTACAAPQLLTEPNFSDKCCLLEIWWHLQQESRAVLFGYFVVKSVSLSSILKSVWRKFTTIRQYFRTQSLTYFLYLYHYFLWCHWWTHLVVDFCPKVRYWHWMYDRSEFALHW